MKFIVLPRHRHKQNRVRPTCFINECTPFGYLTRSFLVKVAHKAAGAKTVEVVEAEKMEGRGTTSEGCINSSAQNSRASLGAEMTEQGELGNTGLVGPVDGSPPNLGGTVVGFKLADPGKEVQACDLFRSKRVRLPEVGFACVY